MDLQLELVSVLAEMAQGRKQMYACLPHVHLFGGSKVLEVTQDQMLCSMAY